MNMPWSIVVSSTKSFNFTFQIIALSAAVFLVAITVAIVICFLFTKRQSNTRTRKLFHILTVAVFLPGIIYQCQFLFVTTVLLLAIFIVLETARTIELKVIGKALDQAIQLFIDEKDAGEVPLTPIYLLVGCSLPLWLHPCPWCPLTDSQIDMLPLLSGVLSVGVGDTIASVVGSKFGRNMWLSTFWLFIFIKTHLIVRITDGVKSIEGTLASIVAQGLVLIVLIYFRYLFVTTFQIYISITAIVLNSFIEANTNQVDNLVLPFVAFIILSLS